MLLLRSLLLLLILHAKSIKWTLTRLLKLLLLLLLHSHIRIHVHTIKLLLLWHSCLEVITLHLLLWLSILIVLHLVIHHLLLGSRHYSRLKDRIWHKFRFLWLLLLSIYRLSSERIICAKWLLV